jgi:hypothetical protein
MFDATFGQTIQYVLDNLKGDVDWPYESTIDDVPGCERGASKRNALTVDRSVYQHARTAENRAVTGRIGDPCGLEPSRPGAPVVETQEWKFQQIRWRGDGLRLDAQVGSPGPIPDSCVWQARNQN